MLTDMIAKCQVLHMPRSIAVAAHGAVHLLLRVHLGAVSSTLARNRYTTWQALQLQFPGSLTINH